MKITFELALQNIHNFFPLPHFFVAEPADPVPSSALGMSVTRSIAPSRNLPKAPTYPERYWNRDGGMGTLRVRPRHFDAPNALSAVAGHQLLHDE